MSKLHDLAAASLMRRTGRSASSVAAWPEGSVASAHDIRVDGRSLTDLALSRRTPCVLIPAAHASTDGCSAPQRTLVIMRITDRADASGWHGSMRVTVDAVESRWMDARLLTSPRSNARTSAWITSARDPAIGVRTKLSADASPGDFIVFVCRGTLALNQVASRPDHDEEPGPLHCMR